MSSLSEGLNHLDTERPLAQSRIERNGIKAGTAAPDFTLPGIFGGTVSLGDYRGRRVLVVFSDPQCGPCQALAPDLVRLASERRDLEIVMVSRGDLEANKAKARVHAFPFPVVLQDGWNLSKEYGMFATPIAFEIDERGFTTHDVAVGADAIVGLAAMVAAPVSRWAAVGKLAAAFAAGLLMQPASAAAQPTCQSGQTRCAGTCTNLQSDSQNCGKCGVPCPRGYDCEVGSCQLECQSGLSICAGRCVDEQSDNQNCGKCGVVCPSGTICSVGTCQLTCQSGLTICHGVCVNEQTDNQNCGKCGVVCPPGTICSVGTCGTTCGSGLQNCRGSCTNLSWDPLNCGLCGKVCPAGYVCSNGSCVKLCA